MSASLGRLLVVHWNQPAACGKTVRALLAQNLPLDVTVIDNHSDPANFAQLETEMSSLGEIVRLEENRGWGGALNVLLRRWLEVEATSFCLISAHDAAPEPDCLALLVAACQRDSRIGIACPQYTEPFVARLSPTRGIFPANVSPRPRGEVELVDAPHGTLMLVKRECLREIGLFDERYFAYGDEHELGLRARRRGWKVALVWGAIVVNPGTWTASAWRSYFFARNSLLLVHDYFGRRAAWRRALLLLANTLRLATFSRADNFAFSGKARWRAVRDHLAGRYGKPRW